MSLLVRVLRLLPLVIFACSRFAIVASCDLCSQNISLLVILDLCGNPLAASTKNYRLFVVYHVTSLKALDGVAVVSP